MNNKEALGKQIKDFRLQRGFSQAQLAKEINVTISAISKWENGKNYPDLETLRLLTKTLNVPFEVLCAPAFQDSECAGEESNSLSDSNSSKKYQFSFVQKIAFTASALLVACLCFFIGYHLKNAASSNYRILSWAPHMDELYGEIGEVIIYTTLTDDKELYRFQTIELSELWEMNESMNTYPALKVCFYSDLSDAEIHAAPKAYGYLFQKGEN